MVLALSVTGFALAAVYALVGAPDVALVAVLVETIVTLVVLGALSRLPRTGGAGLFMRPAHPRRARRNPIVGVVAGLGAFVTIWGTLSRSTLAPGDAVRQTALAPGAHGTDVVTVIHADFRALDTMGEITVLAIAIVGVAALLRRGRLW
jgi:multicomponent Na+:H+ antiporter subunit A